MSPIPPLIPAANCPGCGRGIFLSLIQKEAQLVGFQVATDSRFSNQDETLTLDCPNCAGTVRVHASGPGNSCRLVVPPAFYECGCGKALYLQVEQIDQRIFGIRLVAEEAFSLDEIMRNAG